MPPKFYSHCLDISIDKYNNEIGEIVGNIMTRKSLTENEVDELMSLVGILNSTEAHFNKSHNLIKGTSFAMEKFINNEKLCSKCIETVSLKLSENESNQNKLKRDLIFVIEKLCNETGMIKTILEALKKHATDAELCKKGFYALQALTTVGNKTSLNKPIKSNFR